MTRFRLHRRSAAAAARPRGAAAAACRLLPRAAGLRLHAASAQAKAWLACLCLFLLGAAQAAPPPNTSIVNTATATYRVAGLAVDVSGSATVTTSERSPARIQLLSTADRLPDLPAQTTNIAPTQCRGPVGWGALPAPVAPGQGPLAVPGDHRVAPARMYASGDVVLLQVTDQDQNRAADVRELVLVRIGTDGGDSEQLRLVESGPSSGVFIGYIQSAKGAAQPGNCRLEADGMRRITATYLDASENDTLVSAGAMVDPLGLVFDASTGTPVDGVRITLVDTATGQPASVFGNDGVSTFPATVLTGGTVRDSSGARYAFGPGRYQYPRVAPGRYRFELELPPGWSFPSRATDRALQALPGAPFALGDGSRGEVFAVARGPAMNIDLPLDPGPLGELNIAKSAGKTGAAVGDLVPYTLSIGSRAAHPLPDVQILDRLPAGFRYVPGSARLDDRPLRDPQVGAGGGSLRFTLGTLAANAAVVLRYAVAIGPGAPLGPAENSAQALGRVVSNVARATITVNDDLNRTRAILMGRVMVAESCAQDEREPGAVQGLPGVRLLLQDGTAVVTDAEGNWHAENLRPGTHVVQIDRTTLPAGLELRNCDRTSRTGGRDLSQLVNVRGGTLWRADFRLVRSGTCAGQQPLAPAAQEAQAAACARLPLAPAAAPAAAVPASAEAAPTPQLVEKLPYDDKWLAAAQVGNEWLHPRTGFNPALPVVKVAVKHVAGSQVELRVNGAPVDALRFDGSVKNPAGTMLLSNWRAVELKEGANLLAVTVRGAQGQLLLQESRTIHFALGPASVALDAQRSQLTADGRVAPVIAVRMLDRNGKPVRRGLAGEVNVVPPHLPQQVAELLLHDPLALPQGSRARFQVGDDGVALVALQPTMQSGEAVLRFDFGDNRQHEVRAWLQADLREWILVGFAEGTLGHKRLAGNLQALAASEAGEQLFEQDRLAFYAKGRIRGDYLLTLAYDSAKEKPAGQERVLYQQVDPNQFYTLYGDASQPQHDAASTGKLYLRIEKKQFYALFGDFDTGLTVTELGRYSRTLTGLKSGYKGETFSYTVFATRTRQAYMKDELQGDGTSGLYRLRARDILANSEKVRIEVRDRFQPDRVLSLRVLSPWIDYELDRAAGTLLLREPVPSRDAELNPVFIVVEYETQDTGAAGWTYGGRVAAQVAPQAEVGVTHLREGNPGREGRLTAVDASVRLGEGTKLRAEAATSQAAAAAGRQGGQAWLVEATHDDGQTAARAYASSQEPGFGLGQQAGAAAAQRKAGADARYRVSEQLQLQGEAYRQQDLAGSGERKVVEGRVHWTDKEAGLTASGGARLVAETSNTGEESEARQLTGAVAYEMLERKLVLRAATDLAVGGSGTVNFPNRLALGIDYRITPETTLFASHEIARGDLLRANTTRAGVRTALWQGAEAQLGAGNQTGLDAGRLFASMGLVQKLKFGEHWSADFGLDRVQTLRSRANPLGPAQPLASGTPPAATYGILAEDHTAVSIGLAYSAGPWSGTARLEWRDGETEDKVNLLAGVQRKLGQGRIVAAGLSVLEASAPAGDTRQATLRAGHAWRPSDSRWAWLQRLEYVEDKNASVAARLFTRKLIANFNGNFKASPRTQLALQYSGKYVREMLGDLAHSGYTDLWGGEARHELGERWDFGLHVGLLSSWRLHARSWQYGLSVGYRVAENTWVTLGYNRAGFTERDFAGADYRVQGFYVNLRVKFDQDTFDLNDRRQSLADLKP